MTSLDAAGIHISILKLLEEYKKLYIDCLDDTTEAPCWPGCAYSLPALNCIDKKFSSAQVPDTKDFKKNFVGPKLNERESRIIKECLINACKAIINNEETLNTLDRGCGDGDCGSTHKKLADSK